MDLAYTRDHTLELIKKKTFNSKIKIEMGDLKNNFFFFYRNAKMCQLVQI